MNTLDNSYIPFVFNQSMKLEEPDDKIAQPIWDEITQTCKDKITEKYKEYGNSWVALQSEQFWMERLAGEFNELFTIGISNKDRMRETVDIINICAMYYTNLKLRLGDGKLDGV